MNEPALKRYIVTYTATVYAVDEEEACANMLDSDDFETDAVEDV